ncbi:MAG: tetratricopeptide repeat protein [Bdellovibrionales bacterium]|nr:tetratricopeptide repeat protein [Bdellovibrionales bacterium]
MILKTHQACQSENELQKYDMNEINPVLVEKYQLMLQADPSAKVFAPLAEAYRKMGLVEEGLQLCLRGIDFHPDFASGRVALGRLYLQKNNLDLAVEQLQKAVDLAPENLLAQSLLGETLLKLRRPKEALQAFKMLLLLNPLDQKAQRTVRKMESITADEYDDDVFAMSKLSSNLSHHQVSDDIAEPIKPLSEDLIAERSKRDLERFVSLADAFLVRNDFDRALQTLENAEKSHGPHPEIIKRLKLLNQRFIEDESEPHQDVTPQSREDEAKQRKRALLIQLQNRISQRRRNT